SLDSPICRQHSWRLLRLFLRIVLKIPARQKERPAGGRLFPVRFVTLRHRGVSFPAMRPYQRLSSACTSGRLPTSSIKRVRQGDVLLLLQTRASGKGMPRSTTDTITESLIARAPRVRRARRLRSPAEGCAAHLPGTGGSCILL